MCFMIVLRLTTWILTKKNVNIYSIFIKQDVVFDLNNKDFNHFHFWDKENFSLKVVIALNLFSIKLNLSSSFISYM